MGMRLRADDGLALSSRNGYLSPSERAQAVQLSVQLRHMAVAIQSGTVDWAALEAQVRETHVRGVGDVLDGLKVVGAPQVGLLGHVHQHVRILEVRVARELRRLGQEVDETEDALEIHPRPLRAGETVETHGDHRFAMSFAILGCHDLRGDGKPWLAIRNPACCAKTFPNFFEVLEKVRITSHPDEPAHPSSSS